MEDEMWLCPDESNTRGLCVALCSEFGGVWEFVGTGGNCSAIACDGFANGEPVAVLIANDGLAPVVGSSTLTYVSMTNDCGDWSDEWPVYESLNGNDEMPLRVDTVVAGVREFVRRYGFVPSRGLSPAEMTVVL